MRYVFKNSPNHFASMWGFNDLKFKSELRGQCAHGDLPHAEGPFCPHDCLRASLWCSLAYFVALGPQTKSESHAQCDKILKFRDPGSPHSVEKDLVF